MARYIDADALKLPDKFQIDQFDEPYYRGIGNGWNIALKECRERIGSAPTISPDEVRGVGKWESTSANGEEFKRCSNCGAYLKEEFFNLGYFVFYCPNCGSKNGGSK